MMNFKQYPNMTKCIIPDGVQLSNTNMWNAFAGMTNLRTICTHNGVRILNSAYALCVNLTTAVCGENVTNMQDAYYGCTSLTTAACGPNATNMWGAYANCTNLTTAACGDKVTVMENAYHGCTNLTTAVFGASVTNIGSAYYNCPNIQGNVYMYSNNINSCFRCFNGRNASNRLNIYVHSDTTTNTTVMTKSLVGYTMTLTDDTATNSCHYNTQYNIYIYPVANVAAAREANGD